MEIGNKIRNFNKPESKQNNRSKGKDFSFRIVRADWPNNTVLMNFTF